MAKRPNIMKLVTKISLESLTYTGITYNDPEYRILEPIVDDDMCAVMMHMRLEADRTIEEIAKRWPHLEILFCVRGDVTLNDATRADAAAVGIPFPVIDNGNRVPGTQIDMLSDEAREALNTADVILAKGMANCETMYGCGYNVYYAFLVKCQRFVDRFCKPMLTPMLVKERA